MQQATHIYATQLPADAGDGLATQRLCLRRFTLDDLPLLQRLNADPEVMRYLGGAMSAEKTEAMLKGRILTYYDEQPRMGVWATLLRDSSECVGFHLLNHVLGEDILQIGYRLFPQYWGHGYATEMSFALMEYGFTRLQLPMLTANAALGNIASQRVLLKVGLQRRGERSFSHPAYASFGAVAYFEQDAATWLAQHRNTTQ